MSDKSMEVIMYKILRYLNDASEAGKKIKEEDFCYDSRLFSIPYSWWCEIIEELYQNGYIKNVYIMATKDGKIVDASEAQITIKGREFLKENSQIRKAEKFAGKAFEIVLSSVISGLVSK